MIDDRIVAAIDTELAAKGFTKAETPDVFVVYHVAFDSQKDISTYSTGYAGVRRLRLGLGRRLGAAARRRRRCATFSSAPWSSTSPTPRRQVAWRGMGVKEVQTQAKPEKRDKSIKEAVKKIFKNYPPKLKTRRL